MMEQGTVEGLLPQMHNRDGLLVSHNFARLHKLSAGSRIHLDTPTGRREFRIAGVQVDYTSDAGLLIVDRETYKRLWNDDRVDTFDIMLHDGYDPIAVRAAIQRKLAGSRNAFVLTNREMRAEIMRLTVARSI